MNECPISACGGATLNGRSWVLQVSAINAIDTFMPGTRTGIFALAGQEGRP